MLCTDLYLPTVECASCLEHTAATMFSCGHRSAAESVSLLLCTAVLRLVMVGSSVQKEAETCNLEIIACADAQLTST